ncbi:MAG: hypothetical protein ACJ8FY_06315 [Gemmataceae bacterium]
MLLAVAGLDADAITERTRRLGNGDWSKFFAGGTSGFWLCP